MTNHKILQTIITVDCASFSCLTLYLLFFPLFVKVGLLIADQDLGMGRRWSEAVGEPVFLTSAVLMGCQ